MSDRANVYWESVGDAYGEKLRRPTLSSAVCGCKKVVEINIAGPLLEQDETSLFGYAICPRCKTFYLLEEEV